MENNQFETLSNMLIKLLSNASAEDLEAIDAIAVASMKTYYRLKQEMK